MRHGNGRDLHVLADDHRAGALVDDDAGRHSRASTVRLPISARKRAALMLGGLFEDDAAHVALRGDGLAEALLGE